MAVHDGKPTVEQRRNDDDDEVLLGTLQRAHFDMKTFANEICRFICESVSDHIKPSTLLAPTGQRCFADFRRYFGKPSSSYSLLSLIGRPQTPNSIV